MSMEESAFSTGRFLDASRYYGYLALPPGPALAKPLCIKASRHFYVCNLAGTCDVIS